MSKQPAANRYLRIYLQDHHAGATGGLRLAERAAREHSAGELGSFLSGLATEIRSDRETLEHVMRLLRVPPDDVKRAIVVLVETVGRAKPNGHLLSPSPLTPVVELETLAAGVVGKKALWQSLAQVADGRLEDVDFEALIERADRQLEGLEHARLAAAGRAFGA